VAVDEIVALFQFGERRGVSCGCNAGCGGGVASMAFSGGNGGDAICLSGVYDLLVGGGIEQRVQVSGSGRLHS
jgi:hypothetical protein